MIYFLQNRKNAVARHFPFYHLLLYNILQEKSKLFHLFSKKYCKTSGSEINYLSLLFIYTRFLPLSDEF